MHILFAIFIFLPFTTFASPHPHHHKNTVPIGIMGEHTHPQGEYMLSYRYMEMAMEGNKDGDSNISVSDIHQNFMMAPLTMKSKMHMFAGMFGFTDEITLIAMIPYLEKEMKMEMRSMMGNPNTLMQNSSKGLGDIKFNTIYQANHNLNLNLGISLPTGSINRRDSNGSKLAYPMQMGSGSFSLLPKITVTNAINNWLVGTQFHANIRIGRNQEGYRLGNEYAVNAWALRKLNNSFALSGRLTGKFTENIEGEDNKITKNTPNARTDYRASESLFSSFGINYIVNNNSEISLEFTLPIYQHFEGIQMRNQNMINLGIKKEF